ncbi:hypothetical protein [Fodinibius salsisoli]|uniref:Uncharacterized protein n=1 Tax=Fodinibius salsisoli TaxID=2820877 RepID=A0ABT3PJE0_9BACT|nr:hypothetical protein [Fodinibius salsisoli]MCW9706017.1 hypothetical protein [Fodinibius salsisoli]
MNEELALKMDRTSAIYPVGVSEVERQYLGLVPSAKIKMARISEAPASLKKWNYTIAVKKIQTKN